MNLGVIKSYWKFNFGNIILALSSSLLQIFGILWLITEISSFYFPGAESFLKSKWFLFLIIGFLWGLYKSRPKIKISHCLLNRDVSIQIIISDFFKQSGSFIIGSNTTFDTDTGSGLINNNSIQGQFTKIYYDKIEHIDKDLDEQLSAEKFELIKDERTSKNKRYKIGTVAKINPHNQTAYFLAIADINKYGAAQGSFENLKIALSNLWEFVVNHGDLDNLIIPILGTGFTRLQNKREEIIHEIIQSFVAANSEKKFCNKLIVVISPKDYNEYGLNIQKLDSYLSHICEYTEFNENQIHKVGEPL